MMITIPENTPLYKGKKIPTTGDYVKAMGYIDDNNLTSQADKKKAFEKFGIFGESVTYE